MLQTPIVHDFEKGYARHTASPIQAKLIMIKSSNAGRGALGSRLVKYFWSSPKVQFENSTEKAWIHRTFPVSVWLQSVSQFWITAHEGLYFGSSSAYLGWYNQFLCLFEDCIRIAGLILSLSPSKHGPSCNMGWVGWGGGWGASYGYISFLCLHMCKAVLEENFIPF